MVKVDKKFFVILVSSWGLFTGLIGSGADRSCGSGGCFTCGVCSAAREVTPVTVELTEEARVG